MQQAAADLFRGEGREAGPLQAWVLQPQAGVGGVDCAVAGLGVGDQGAAGGDYGFGHFLAGAPGVLAALGLRG